MGYDVREADVQDVAEPLPGEDAEMRLERRRGDGTHVGIDHQQRHGEAQKVERGRLQFVYAFQIFHHCKVT